MSRSSAAFDPVGLRPDKVAPDLWPMLDGDPAARLEAIVVAEVDLDELLAGLPSEVTVEHRYRLINSISVTARADALLALTRLPMVRSIESVRPVSALPQT